MNIPNPSEYGPLAGIVSLAGMIMAAALAIALAWRGRTRWEPSEEDITRGPQKVGGLLIGVLVVVTWANLSQASDLPQAKQLTLMMSGSTVVFLLAYGFLVATQTFVIIYSPSANKTATKNAIGGLWLTKEALSLRKKNKVTTQELLKGGGYDVDKVWSRPSRALAKLLFVVCYLGLTVSGSLALTCASIVLDLSTKK